MGVIDTGIHKSKYSWADDILNLSPTRKKINAYPRKEKNYGDDSSMDILDDEKLIDTIIYGNIYLRGNIILEIRDSVLSSLHIVLHTGDLKYRI